ncbi:N(4)-(beta-N-acetylglucosaminyl)-L-asparaginase [Pedobacter xixiisoli]|uniref:Asparaginase n=1 Tax=Pedobacter xixiisoli TaxID=1476464 RepID=A0A285ZTH8_9SPHI|nr:N(4)-(beta-N-acetylglucosaminyl)-L-asparaginase [Pedobacter xixiisoli]SOD12938.1 asparaginase [Pedobacter xixiisoli]
MYNRRKFIQTTALSAAVITLSKSCTSKDKKANKPIVISTWDFGVAANADAWKILNSNGKALDAVENGVKVAEADVKNQSVGYGGLPDRDGIVTLDACIMDHISNCGAVLALENIKHPISVARLVMEKTPHVMLAGDGALQFAIEQGFKKENLLTENSKAAWDKWVKTAKYEPVSNIENKLYDNSNNNPLNAAPEKLPGNQYNHDTIGMLALDSHGNLAGACTTSGMAYKLHGRIGDSPIIGAGLYIDNEVGGATATGVGEEVVRNVGSFLVVELMRQGYSPEEACKEAVMRIIKKKANSTKDLQVGFLALNKNGEYGAYAIQKGFTFSVCDKQKQDLIVKGKSYY